MTLDALPLTANGKLDRRALPAPEGSRADYLGGYVAPRDRVELELASIWEDLLGVRPIGIRDDFFEAGGHSLLAMRLVARIQERFGHGVPLAALLGAGTVETLAELLRREEARVDSPVVPLRATGSRPRFFCVHPGGGGVLCYRDLAEHLGEEQPFFAFQARGLDGGPVPEAAGMEELARSYVEALRRLQPHGPYLLGGWSFGGLVAFEMARQLDTVGERCDAVILLDTPAPGVRTRGDEVAELVALAGEAGLALSESEKAELRRLSPAARLDHLAALVTAAGLLPADLGAEPLRRLLAVYRAHQNASRNYAPDVYPGRIAVVRATERLNDEFPGLGGSDSDYGWGRYCAEPPLVLPVPGNHLTMVRPPQVRALAAVLAGLLASPTEMPEAVEAAQEA
jgi:thioesterase domain-containing protein/acyl carrier protein